MQVLIDTQVLLWFLGNSRRLSSRARKLIGSAERVVVSSASIWECCIKVALGRLEVDPAALVAGFEASGLESLSITPRHALAIASLPALHEAPFDRMLVAQASSEGFVLLTADRALEGYSALVRRA
jgi:PIN domain nuclease of toxin-antitoxin system